MAHVPAIDPYAIPAGSFLEAIGLHLEPAGPDVATAGLTGWIDVDERHHTPWGVVHGGLWASVVESAASLGAAAAVADRGQFAVGVTNTTDFLRPMTVGRAVVTAIPRQVGRTLQQWDVEITNPEGKLVAQGRLRLANQQLPAT